jgi:uncharacterized protein (DUF111 family)
LLRGVPLAALDVEGELTTPTGAAIVASLASEFGPLPPMTVDRIGYGAGQKEFPQPNILRLLVGEQAVASTGGPAPHVESIVILETNLDDAAGDAVSHAVDRLFAAGALDVAVTPMQMKKGRPALLLSVQARPADVEALEAVLFHETTTLGIRRSRMDRTVLAREAHEVGTAWGPLAGKIAYLPDGTRRFSAEYEAAHRVSIEQGVPLADVLAAARQAFQTE